MDWMTLITSLLTFITGGGVIALFTLPQKKKAAELENEQKDKENEQKDKENKLENERKISTEWERLYRESEKEKEELNRKVDGLYKELGDIRDKLNKLMSDNAVLKILRCDSIACMLRVPPLGGVQLNDDLNSEIDIKENEPNT